MKKSRASRSPYSKFRAFLAFTLCLGGLSIAVTALGAWPGLVATSWFNSQKQASYQAKIKAKIQAAHASKSKIVAPLAPVSSNSSGPSQPFTGEQPTVAKQTNALGQTVFTISPSHFDISPPLTELAKLEMPAPPPEEQREEPQLPASRILRSDKPDPVVQVVPGSDQARDANTPNAPDAPAAAATGFNFVGLQEATPVIGGYPPDENGSVGNDQFVEMVNSRYQVWSLDRATKTATSIAGPANINTLWAGFGGNCQTRNNGDPIVLYDKVANRWFLSQFTSGPNTGGVSGPYFQCVAVSKTANAAGEYYRWAFEVPDTNTSGAGDFGDYPHYGVWSDAYYLMAHNFEGDGDGGFSFVAAVFGAMDRAKMLAGDPNATWKVIADPLEGGHMPADLDGFAPPPAGAPGIFTSLHADGMYLYRMKVDFSNATDTTVALQAIMPIAPSAAACGGGFCIPQPNNPTTLHSLADRLMFRLAYRNYIDHESLVVNHSVDPGVPGVVSGVRWYEFRLSGQPDEVCSTYPCTYQQGTIADFPNGRSRWMGSIAQDGAGNMIVGYSATGTNEVTDAHSIRYTGRVKGQPLGIMTVPEQIIHTGTRNEVADNTAGALPGRWGDYSSTSIDPADDCTFWHVNQFYDRTQGVTNFDWSTKIASISFSAGQCQPSTCTVRPTSAPLIGTATAIEPNKIEITWTAITPAPGSYAIERAVGAVGSEGLYQPLAFVSGSSTSFVDVTAQGAVTYSYRVIAATDTQGRCQALVRSGSVSASTTGSCNLKPTFGGATSASSIDGPACGIALTWAPAVSNCPLHPTIRYNIYRGPVPDFVPSAANRVATCIPAGSSYIDTDNLTSGVTYYYVVRAEDNSTNNGGACGGNEESNNIHVAGTAYGPGTAATPGTWADGGGDVTSLLRLNVVGPGNTPEVAWRIISTADDPDANHTSGGDYAYRNAGPVQNATYGSSQCSVAQTPVLTVGATSVNLTYWERHQMEAGWDGVAIEYSRNGGAWTDVPAPSNSAAGCMASDVTTDYATMACTAPEGEVINACGYPTTKPVITGPRTPPDPAPLDCTASTTGALTNYGRRCHLLTGLTPGDTIQFRWRFASDPGLEFKGFYLDDIAVTNINLPNACVPGQAASPTPTPSPAGTATPTPTPSATPGATATPSATPGATATPSATPGATATPSATPGATATPSATPGATATPSATPGATATPSATPTATPASTPAAQALNLSTRMRVDLGDNAGIGGFIITGNAPKHVIIRAIGPSLTKFGFSASDVLADPTLELRGPGSFTPVTNNNWRDSQEQQIKNDGVAPTNDLESAIDATLAPGHYTAIVRGNGTGKGIALVEVYDLDTAANSKLANLSTRAFVGTANNVVIAGFILGNNEGADRVVVRGRGPSLSAFGISNPLQDPTLELRNENGSLLVTNNDWQDDAAQATEITAAGLAPSDSKESAIAMTLPPGLYTAILAGRNETTGVGLVEVYDRGQ